MDDTASDTFGPGHPEWCPVGKPEADEPNMHCSHWENCEPCCRCGDDTRDPNCDCEKCTAARAVDDVVRLENWKQQALTVLAEWAVVFDALGKPGPLAATKASNTLAEVTRLRSERDALLWALTVSQRDVALWCEEIEHVADCACDDPHDPESTDEACKANSTWRMALIEVDAGHGDRLVTFLPEPDQLRTFGDMMDRARALWFEATARD